MQQEELPSFQLTELVDELARSSDDDGMGDEGLTPCTKMVRDMAADPMTKYLPGNVWRRHCHFICNLIGAVPAYPSKKSD